MGLSDLHRRIQSPAGWHARRGLLVYVAVWLAGAAAVALGAIAILGSGDDDTVSLPPVEEIQLSRAAQTAGCEFRRRGGRALNPRVSGGSSARPAPAGVYDEPQPAGALIAALRRGIVVIQYRRRLQGSHVDELEALQRAVPAGTIVTPNATGMSYDIAVTAYRRLLGCRSFTAHTLDAVRLFRGRFVGSGPDA